MADNKGPEIFPAIKEPPNSKDNKKIEDPKRLVDLETSDTSCSPTSHDPKKQKTPLAENEGIPLIPKKQPPIVNDEPDPNVNNNPGDNWDPNIRNPIKE